MAAVACFNPSSSHVSGHVSVIKRGEANRSNKRGRVKSVTWATSDQICQAIIITIKCMIFLKDFMQNELARNQS